MKSLFYLRQFINVDFASWIEGQFRKKVDHPPLTAHNQSHAAFNGIERRYANCRSFRQDIKVVG